MNIGLFFGSFNPIHTGHLIIASYLANYTELDQVWIVVSPHNPLKKSSDLINMYDRLEMAKIATESTSKIRVSDIEFKLPQPSYTVDTLAYIRERYPDYRFNLIVGSDNLNSLRRWKNFQYLLDNYHFFVYPRPGYKASEFADHPSVSITDTPMIEISSTFIRKSIANNKNVQFFLPDSVIEFIDAKSLYR